MRNKKRAIIVVLVLSALGIAICMRRLIYSVPQNTHITIGVASGYAPWATHNETGELEGFDVDIAHKVAERLNIPLILVDMSPEMLMASVRTKKIDCMIAPMAITPEREKAYHMIHYQGSATDRWPVMICAKTEIVCAQLEDIVLQGYAIGVLPGTKQSEYAFSIENLNVHTYDNMPYILMALRTQKIACALIDPDLGKQLAKDNADMKVMLITVPEQYQSQGNGIAVHKDNKHLASQIVNVIEALKNEGFIRQAETHWGIGRLS